MALRCSFSHPTLSRASSISAWDGARPADAARRHSSTCGPRVTSNAPRVAAANFCACCRTAKRSSDTFTGRLSGEAFSASIPETSAASTAERRSNAAAIADVAVRPSDE